MTGILRVPRSRGALSGMLLILLGAWGALIPFIGPYFHYAYSPDHSWAYTTGRLWLEILPGAAAFLGGLITLAAATRPAAVFGAWMAALAGAWFIVGRPLSTLWTANGTPEAGHAVGGTVTRAVEDIGFFTGLGAVILFLAAVALGRFLVIGAREAALAAEEPATVGTEPGMTEPAAQRGVWEAPRAGDTRADPDATVATDRPAGMTATRPAGRHSAEGPTPPS